MPWIDKGKCLDCGICIDNCPVEAIGRKNGKLEIDMGKCIRCGVCHDICPQKAVRHDSERIPEDVEKNIEWAKELMKHYTTGEEKQKFLERIIKHFNKEKIVAEKSMSKTREIYKEVKD